MDLDYNPWTQALVVATRDFVRDLGIPIEDDLRRVPAQDDQWRLGLQKAARDADVFAPQVPKEYGGHGLGMVERAPVFEEAGVSLFGPLAVNCAAPDEGNVHLLAHVADADQRVHLAVPGLISAGLDVLAIRK
jgi:acyl-CoA dehydrogenase